MERASRNPAHWLDVLSKTPDQLNWMQRSSLPAEAVRWLNLHPQDSAAEQLVELLARDYKWEVRLAFGPCHG